MRWIVLAIAWVVLGVCPVSAQPAFDAFQASAAGTTTRTITFTPVGTPRGILLFVVQLNGTDEISGCTYGGVAASEVTGSPQLLTTGETGGTHAFYLGASIPTGAQTAECTASGTTANKVMFVYALTAGANTEVIDADVVNSAAIVDPSVNLTLSGRTAWTMVAALSGHDAVTGTGALASWNNTNEVDGGTVVAITYDNRALISSTDLAAGFTQTSEDAVMIAVAVGEVVVAGSGPPLGTYSLLGAGR